MHNADVMNMKYQGAKKQSLQTQSKYDGIKYACGECGYKATQKHYLKSHMAAKHGGY